MALKGYFELRSPDAEEGAPVPAAGTIYWTLNIPDMTTAGLLSGPSRPLLVFIHAGISDHTLWDAQVNVLASKGWNVLCFDLFGYGSSFPSDSYLTKEPRPKIAHHDYLANLINYLHLRDFPQASSLSTPLPDKVVVIGCSRGGSHATDFAIAYPELTAGLITICSSPDGFEGEVNQQEVALLEEEFRLTQARDLKALVDFNVHYWGDGPLQEHGRAGSEVREKLRAWTTVNVSRQFARTGHMAIPYRTLGNPPASSRLTELNIPVAAVWGSFDESECSNAMRFVHKQVKGSTIQEFSSAHLPMVELPDEFNAWLLAWLGSNFRWRE
ncbi:hypothetical protein MMC25_005683 [Agyrium rufum]|nr:hypothetical protein [Agyrium rufum]